MKWFKHESDDRNKLESKLIRSKFGAEGYGIFQALKEVVAEYVEQDNLEEWGMVHKLHTIETLADECSTTPEKLREFLAFCNEKRVFEKKDNRLFYSDMLKRLDDFAARIKRAYKPTTKSVRTKYDIEEKRIEENRIKQNRREEKKENTLSLVEKLSNEDFEKISSLYNVPLPFVLSKWDDLLNWCEAKGKRYKNYNAALRNWVKKDALEIRQQHKPKIAVMPTGESP